MPNINDLSESKYVAKEDVGEGLLVTITGFAQKDVSRDSEPTSLKYTLTFDECKPLVLNKTNGKRIAVIMHEVYGITRDYQEDVDGVKCPANEQFHNWIGKKVILWNNPDIEFQGETTGGIRVRAPQNDAHGRTAGQVQEYSDAAPKPTEDDVPFDKFADQHPVEND